MTISKLLTKFNSRFFQILLIILLSFICYANTLGNSFAWDDREFLFNWPLIRNSESGLPAYLSLPELLMGELPLAHKGVFRPLRSVFYLLSYSFYGENPLGYHIQALIIHTLISVIIYLIADVITGRKWLGFFTAALFTVHPVHTEAVSFVTASFDTIGILFFFLSFYFYLASKKKSIERNTYLLASFLFAGLAFLTYEMTLILPIVIIFYDYCKNNFSYRKLLLEFEIYKSYILLLVGYGLLRFLILNIGDRSSLGGSYIVTANQARVGMGEIFYYYFYTLIWPLNLSIGQLIPTATLEKFLWFLYSIDPSSTLITLSANISFIFPLIYTSLFIAVSFILLRKYSLLFFSVAWILITLLPAANIFPQGAAVGIRFLYIPSFGFALALAILSYQIYKSIHSKYLRYLILASLLSLICFYSFVTIQRNKDWLNEETFWQSTIKQSPHDIRAYSALARIYTKQQKHDQAKESLLQGLINHPTSALLHSELGILYFNQGELQKAEHYQKKALEVNKDYFLANYHLGNLYLSQNKYSEAEESYKKVLTADPNHIDSYTALGDINMNLKKPAESVEFYKKSLYLSPYSAENHFKLGKAYKYSGASNSAKEALMTSIDLRPNFPDAYLDLAKLYLLEDNKSDAIEILRIGAEKTRSKAILEELDAINTDNY